MNKTILITIFCLLFKRAYSQNSEPLGIFDMPLNVTAISKTTIREIDGFGESIYKTEKLSNGNWKVQYLHTKPFPNPQIISYTFDIKAQSTNAFALGIEVAMHPSALYLDTTIVKTSYIGDKVILPNKPLSNIELENVKGVYTLRKIADNDILISYELSLTNRRISPKESLVLNGKTYQMYKHSYDYFQRNTSKDDKTIAEYHETVEDTYLEGYGLVNQIRRNVDISPQKENVYKDNRTIKSELLKIN